MKYTSIFVVILCSVLGLGSCSYYSPYEGSSTSLLSREDTTSSEVQSNSSDIYSDSFLYEQFKNLLSRISTVIQNTYTVDNFYAAVDYNSFNRIYNGSLFCLRFIEAVSNSKHFKSTKIEAQNILSLLKTKTVVYLKKTDIPPANILRFIKSFKLDKFQEKLSGMEKSEENKMYFDLFEALQNNDTEFVALLKDHPELRELDLADIVKDIRVGALYFNENYTLPIEIESVSCRDYVALMLNYNIDVSTTYDKLIEDIVVELMNLLDHYEF